MKRQNYIDNLRWIWIVTLIPFHTAMAFNTWESNYIYFHANKWLSTFVIMICPFYMPLLFVLAGMSMKFSLEKRNIREFARERVNKILLPLISGLFTVVAYMTYKADQFHNGYEEGFLHHYKIFLTSISDFTGYDGKFTPAHLWFMLFLFIVSMLLLVIICLQRKIYPKLSFRKLNLWIILLLIVIPLLCYYILDFGGKSIGESFAFVLLGYYVFSEEEVIDRIKKYRYVFLGITLLASILLVIVFVWMGKEKANIGIVCQKISEWFGILGFLSLGKCAFNQSNRFTEYMRVRSFPIYIFHFAWIVFLQYYLGKMTSSTVLLYVATVVGTCTGTLLTIEVIRRIPGVRFLFGMSKK